MRRFWHLFALHWMFGPFCACSRTWDRPHGQQEARDPR